MEYLQYYDSTSDIVKVKRDRPLVVYVDAIDNILYAPDTYEGGVTIELNNDTALLGYLKCVITASSDTTLPVYYTKESFDAETPDETISLTAGDNEFYFDLSIYRIGIVEYDRSTLKRISGNSNITSLILEGVLENAYRMFDNLSFYTTNNINLDLNKLDTSKTTNMFCMFQNSTNYKYGIINTGNLSSWNVSNVTNMQGLFSQQNYLTSVGDLSSWNTSNCLTMNFMFNNCYELTSIGDLSNWNVSKVTNMRGILSNCKNLTAVGDLSSWDVSHVSDMSYMFQCCYKLTSVGDLSNWNTSNTTDISFMFYYCYELTSVGDLSNWDVTNVSNMNLIFYQCYSLTYIGDMSNWVTSNITSISFKHCISLNQDLDVSKWDVSNFKTMEYMFDTCSNLRLTGFKNWNVSNVKNMHGLFRKCISIDPDEFDFSSWDMSKVTDINLIFANQETGNDYPRKDTINIGLTITRIKHLFTIPTACLGGASMFRYDWDLTTIENANTISNTISFSESPLTKDSALVILNALDSENTNTCTFSDYTYNLLSEDDIKIGTDKGWSIAKANPIGKFKCIGTSVEEITDLYFKIKACDDFTYNDLTFVFDDDVNITGTITNGGGYKFTLENNKVINIKNSLDSGTDKLYNTFYLSTLNYNNKIYKCDNNF